ncbi:MAG: DUF1844 domain-containing protein [Oligoflexales bacterium]
MAQNEQRDEISFSALILGFSSAALQHLGSKDLKARAQNLHLARQNIDIIEMLSCKTKGNLEGEEQSLLKDLLEDLKLKFIEASKKPI